MDYGIDDCYKNVKIQNYTCVVNRYSYQTI